MDQLPGHDEFRRSNHQLTVTLPSVFSPCTRRGSLAVYPSLVHGLPVNNYYVIYLAVTPAIIKYLERHVTRVNSASRKWSNATSLRDRRLKITHQSRTFQWIESRDETSSSLVNPLTNTFRTRVVYHYLLQFINRDDFPVHSLGLSLISFFSRARYEQRCTISPVRRTLSVLISSLPPMVLQFRRTQHEILQSRWTHAAISTACVQSAEILIASVHGVIIAVRNARSEMQERGRREKGRKVHINYNVRARGVRTPERRVCPVRVYAAET